MKSVSQVGSVSQDSDALVSQGRMSRGNLMQKVLKPIQTVRFTNSTLRHASIQEKKGTIVGKKQMSQFFISEIPTVWHLRTSPLEVTERQQRCARGKAWNLAKNIYKLKEKDEATFYSPAGEWVLPAASTKEPEEREFVVDSWASMHMVSEKDLNSAELKDREKHRGFRRRWWRPTARCKPEKKRRCMSKNWTYSWRLCFLKKQPHRSSSSREALWGSWVHLSLDHRSKTTLHQKWQESWL